jgi:hypothetical protein
LFSFLISIFENALFFVPFKRLNAIVSGSFSSPTFLETTFPVCEESSNVEFLLFVQLKFLPASLAGGQSYATAPLEDQFISILYSSSKDKSIPLSLYS